MVFYQGLAKKWNGGAVSVMWGTFAIAVIVCVVFLFLPGFLVLRALRMPHWMSLTCAPLVGVACYSVLCVCYGMVGLSCSWTSVFLPVVALALVVVAIARFAFRSRDALSPNRDDLIGAGAYALVGAIICGFVFVGQLSAPDAFIQSWDNVHHLDKVRGFVDSGRWSSLGTSLYLGRDAAIDPFVEGSFYPSAWHALAAMVASAVGASAPLAVNATNFAILAFAFPLGVFAFIRALVGKPSMALIPGAIVVLANASCAWTMFSWGPLYPNIMANCLVPAFMVAFVLATVAGVGRGERLAAVLVLAFGAVSFVFVQPNGVFTAGVLLAPYVVVRVYEAVKGGRAQRRSDAFARGVGVACAVAVVGAIALVWLVAYRVPFMQAVVQYNWPADTELGAAFVDVLTQRFHVPGLAIGCALLIACGIVAVFMRRKHRWLVASWIFASAIYVVCVSVPGEPHQLLAGFWYTDVPRVASMAVLAGIPLQILGLSEVVRGAVRPFERKGTAATAAVGAAMTVVVAAMLYVPIEATESHQVERREFTNGSALAAEVGKLCSEYRFDDPRVYDEQERAFVAEALALMPEGSLVANEPNDGSAYAYGVDGLRTYYRYWRGYGDADEGEKPESALIREHLDAYATDAEVAAAVELVGIDYVLQLEQGERDWNHTMWVYGDGELWRGLDAINDQTPGFELVLSRDDMRLYRIVK